MSLDLFNQALKAEGITGKLADLARSIYSQESGGGRNTSTSNRGAVGGMQILPGTFGEVADKGWDIQNPLHNARAGIRYLKQMADYAGGDPALAAAGYYGGRGGIDKARKGVAVSDPKNPKAPNTLQYAAQVVGRLPGGATQLASQVPVGRQPDGSVQHVAPVAEPAVVVAGAPTPFEPPPLIQAEAEVPMGGASAWQTFLKTLTPQSVAAVQPEDLSYGVAPAPRQYAQADIQAPSGQVSFMPFGQFAAMNDWGRRKKRQASARSLLSQENA